MNQARASLANEPGEVLTFWLGDGMARGWPSEDMNERWFKGGKALDAQIDQQFGATVDAALDGELQSWETSPAHRLALIILLDQFPRNIYRGTARAFAGDARAQLLVLSTLETNADQQLPAVARVFLYMPLMHAENLGLQNACVACFEQLQRTAPHELAERLQSNLDFARQHQAIIARFGRFPYRNAVLGRVDTPEEESFLSNGPRFGQ